LAWIKILKTHAYNSSPSFFSSLTDLSLDDKIMRYTREKAQELLTEVTLDDLISRLDCLVIESNRSLVALRWTIAQHVGDGEEARRIQWGFEDANFEAINGERVGKIKEKYRKRGEALEWAQMDMDLSSSYFREEWEDVRQGLKRELATQAQKFETTMRLEWEKRHIDQYMANEQFDQWGDQMLKPFNPYLVNNAFIANKMSVESVRRYMLRL
jgi:hypothetical protein